MGTARFGRLFAVMAAAGCATVTPSESRAPATPNELRAASNRVEGREQEVERRRAGLDQSPHEIQSVFLEPKAKWPRRPPGCMGVPWSAVQGRVLAADNESGAFLLSKGSRDLVRVGDEFAVFRGDSFVAVLVTYKVFEDRSVAEVKLLEGRPLRQSDLRRGDRFASLE